jgi:hypothetical protein
MLPRLVVSLQRAGKYQRPAWRPLQGQKGLDERVVMASQWPSHAWRHPRSGPCGRTSSAQAPSPCRFPPLCVLTPSLAVATAAPDTARPLSGSRHDRSTRLPSLAYRGAIASQSPCHWWAGAGGGVAVSWHGGDKSCDTSGITPAGGATRLHPCRAWRPDDRWPPHAGGGRG